MNLRKLILLAFLGALLFLSVHARAEEGDDGEDDAPGAGVTVEEEDEGTVGEEEETGPETGAIPEVETFVYFPDHQDKRFPIGDKVTLLVLVKNVGDEPFQLTGMAAHLHSVFDVNYYIQNFTGRDVGVVVEPHREASVEYAFMTDKSLEPLAVHFSAFIEYNSTSGDTYRTTIVNGTVDLFDQPGEWDLKSLLSYAVGLGVMASLANIFFSMSKSGKPSRSRTVKAAPSTEGASSKSSIEEWAGPIYKPKPTAQKSKSSGKKSQ